MVVTHYRRRSAAMRPHSTDPGPTARSPRVDLLARSLHLGHERDGLSRNAISAAIATEPCPGFAVVGGTFPGSLTMGQEAVGPLSRWRPAA